MAKKLFMPLEIHSQQETKVDFLVGLGEFSVSDAAGMSVDNCYY